ncbi:UNVERIFIED_CONTAM: hypothetical protein K2H54_019051 [Gekko kuhli]
MGSGVAGRPRGRMVSGGRQASVAWVVAGALGEPPCGPRASADAIAAPVSAMALSGLEIKVLQKCPQVTTF